MKTTKEILREVKAELDARDREIELLREKLSRRRDRTVFRVEKDGTRTKVPYWTMLASRR